MRAEVLGALARVEEVFGRVLSLLGRKHGNGKRIRADAEDGMVTVHVPKSQVEANKRAEIKTAWITPF